ncbi:MAG TPA: hypothetical protein VF026_32510 [Ktedonobacteraceae bacterium]
MPSIPFTLPGFELTEVISTAEQLIVCASRFAYQQHALHVMKSHNVCIVTISAQHGTCPRVAAPSNYDSVRADFAVSIRSARRKRSRNRCPISLHLSLGEPIG